MTEQEREQAAQEIYVTLYLDAGYTARCWASLHGFEKERFYRAAEKQYARWMVARAGRIAAGRAA
jgi:hypothetical protein